MAEDVNDEPETPVAEGEKRCEQCHTPKLLTAFHRRKTKADGDGRMRICGVCYRENLETQRLAAEERMRQWKAEWEAQVERERAERERERERELEERRLAVEEWDRHHPWHRCIDCVQTFPASVFVPWLGFSLVADPAYQPDHFRQRCEACHKEYRERNRQANPLCPMCNAPPRERGGFLREYHGYKLDIIRVCCSTCLPRFEELPEGEQLEWLRRAMVTTYGETAVIYALQYDDHFPCQHIGRTKRYERRMADYRRNWHRKIKHHFILEEVPFGPLSMERESRWMMHALKCGWPIDNFELFKGGEDGLSGQRQQAILTEAVQAFDPLTAPFETVEPLIRGNFLNTRDTAIVNWYVSLMQARL